MSIFEEDGAFKRSGLYIPILKSIGHSTTSLYLISQGVVSQNSGMANSVNQTNPSALSAYPIECILLSKSWCTKL